MVAHANDFWLRAVSDLVQPLGQVLSMESEHQEMPKLQKVEPSKQMLSLHPDYRTLVHVSQEMTCLRRSDGICSLLDIRT